MIKITYKKRDDGNLVKVYFDTVSSATSFVKKIVMNGCVEGFVKIEEMQEVNEK